MYILENMNYYSQNAFTIRIALHGHLIRILQFEGLLPCISNTSYEWRGSTTASVPNRVTPSYNPLRTKLFFPVIFNISRKIGCYRLPTHKRGTHRNFFHDPFLFIGLRRRQCYVIFCFLLQRVQNLGMSYESIKASFKELMESRGLLPITVNEAMDIVATWQENRAEQASVRR